MDYSNIRIKASYNREYLAPQIRSMNTRLHSEAKLPWSYDYLLLIATLGRTVGRAVKALDSQPRDRGFESLRTLSLQYLKSLGKICTRNVLRFNQS